MRWILLLLISSPLLAQHGGTTTFNQTNSAEKKTFSAPVPNETLPILWSSDGTELYMQLADPAGERSWKAVDLASGERRNLPEKPKGKKSITDVPDTKTLRPRAGHSDKKSKARFQSLIEQAAPLPDGWVWSKEHSWSPLNDRVLAWINTTNAVREVHYVRSSPKDHLQPESFSIPYPKPGDTLNIAHPVILFTNGQTRIDIDQALVANPYDIRHAHWQPDGIHLLVEFIERGFGKHSLIDINTENGDQRELITDEAKFVYVFGNGFRHNLPASDEILWRSERDGWNHLYLFDAKTGAVIRQLTKGTYVVREVVAVDEVERSAVLKLGGYYPEQDPYYIHFARVDLDTGELTLLTDADGTHALFWSPDLTHYVAKWSRVDHPPVHELRRASDGKKLQTLSRADMSALLATGWTLPQRFVAKDRNGEFDIHGVILRPNNLATNTPTAVIESIYAGPHGAFVPKSWRTDYGHMNELTTAGFIVVKIDGLGTNHRGQKFHQVAYKNIIDSGLPDRIKWMRAAAAQHPELDLDRVGIYGGSAGGQSTLAALLTHPDFYKAGVADCGCHDNRMDKIWWNEQWMDWPVDETYAENSNLTHIDKLQGALMLTVGEVDKNVDPASTLQIVNGLIQADKDFEFYLIPNGGHGIGESPYLRRKRVNFFKHHLRKLE